MTDTNTHSEMNKSFSVTAYSKNGRGSEYVLKKISAYLTKVKRNECNFYKNFTTVTSFGWFVRVIMITVMVVVLLRCLKVKVVPTKKNKQSILNVISCLQISLRILQERHKERNTTFRITTWWWVICICGASKHFKKNKKASKMSLLFGCFTTLGN